MVAAAVAVGGVRAKTRPDGFLIKIKVCDQTATSADPQRDLSNAGHQEPLLRLPEHSFSFPIAAVIDSHIRPTTAAARSLVSPLRMVAHFPRPPSPPRPVVGGPRQGPPHTLGSGAGQRLSRSGGGAGLYWAETKEGAGVRCSFPAFHGRAAV